MILEILIAFLAGFLFFPVFLWFIWPFIVDVLLEKLTDEKDRLEERRSKKDAG